METTFIPGPWSFVPSVPEEGYECYWIENGVQRVTSIEGPQNAEREATARLIAAAPEMFEELRTQMELLWNPFEPDNQCKSYKRIAALLARVTGEQA